MENMAQTYTHMIGTGYDIVGDIHGHADPLRRLLDKLDYAETEGVFRHPERQMIFVGDFIDRGPEQREVLRIARTMCEAGAASAVMGNHEFNAIGWATANGTGGFHREHSAQNTKQHAKFIAAYSERSPDYNDAIRWFKTLPVWIELPGLRVIHACWHEASRTALMPYLDEHTCFTEQGLHESFLQSSAAHAAVEILLKGPEQVLPNGIHFLDKDGHRRDEVRLRWWDNSATTFRTAALGLDGREQELPDTQLPTNFSYSATTPVFFGHYWLKDYPRLTASNAACLDFSVAKEGFLTAYRWSGEARLMDENLVSVPA
jgi:hypothetical protein